MKKILVLALAIVMALSVVALAACTKPLEGEYSYANAYNSAQKYGCKVKVIVDGEGKIASVEVEEDTENFFNLSAGWKNDDGTDTDGKKAWIANGKKMAESFVGLTVEEVKAIKVACDDKTVKVDTEGGKFYYSSVAGQPQKGGISGAPAALKVVAGATQSSGRLILAVQDALKDYTPSK